MKSEFVATNAISSGIELDRKKIKNLSRRSDRPGIIYLCKWIASLLCSGYLIYLSSETLWIWPAMFIHGVILSVPGYSMSHETAHGTAFKTRWLNEAVNWISSLIYLEEPLHRRYTHTNHHTYTWHVGKDVQMPFDTPMTIGGWLVEISGFALTHFHLMTLLRLASGRYTREMKSVIPEDEFPRIRRNAWIFILVYVSIAILIISGFSELLWYLLIPMVLGRPVMLLFGLIQHVEMMENSPSILESTRSFRTNPIGEFLYMNMNNHVEHHLYPQVPFYSLPRLHEQIKDQLPEPDPGFWRTNIEALSVVIRRSLGRNTKAWTIRQAAHMITQGGYEKVSSKSMR